MQSHQQKIRGKRFVRCRALVTAAFLIVLAGAGGACFSGDEGESFYGRVATPRAQEFRWSDGGVPRVFDPARASAPPDTDAVRALFEGLTDYDPQTLRPVSGVAYRWDSSTDGRVWTFYLREDARWSNGDPVTAQDYQRSWQRTLRLGDDAPHAALLSNLLEDGVERKTEFPTAPAPAEGETPTLEGTSVKERVVAEGGRSHEPRLAVDVIDEHVLRLRLRRPDQNLPSLLAHPVFRPVHSSVAGAAAKNDQASARPPEGGNAQPQSITNGAFRLTELGDDKVVLERESHYWNAAQVALERVRFVGSRDTEGALKAYRDGEIDALTNANVEPVGLKLLASYQDYRRTTFGALTFYDFNATRPPFDDPRVRRALALAVDRKRLSDDTLEGSTVPAETFLPVSPPTEGGEKSDRLTFDPTRARLLLAEAGYPGGAGFPAVRLLVNRNDQHRLVAHSIAEMWKRVLGIETEVLLKGWDEYETRLRSGEYDVAKRSMLLQTPDEETNMLAMFDPERLAFGAGEARAVGSGAAGMQAPNVGAKPPGDKLSSGLALPAPIYSEPEALARVPAIPIYFASSFALVKPYVQGFDTNILDAPSLRHVRIDASWQPPQDKAEPPARLSR